VDQLTYLRQTTVSLASWSDVSSYQGVSSVSGSALQISDAETAMNWLRVRSSSFDR
jgi:hypothetical protein